MRCRVQRFAPGVRSPGSPANASPFATTFIGGIWFTVLFGKAYSAALDRAHDPAAKPAPTFIVGPIVCSFITTVTSATLTEGPVFGLTIGLGYSVATMTNTSPDPNFPRPLGYATISGPCCLLTTVATNVILVWMP